MVGLDEVVEIFDLTVNGVGRIFALGFECVDGYPIGCGFIGVDGDGDGFFPIFQPVEGLAR